MHELSQSIKENLRMVEALFLCSAFFVILHEAINSAAPPVWRLGRFLPNL